MRSLALILMLSSEFTVRIFMETIVTGRLPSNPGVHLRATQRAPFSTITTLVGGSGRSI